MRVGVVFVVGDELELAGDAGDLMVGDLIDLVGVVGVGVVVVVMVVVGVVGIFFVGVDDDEEEEDGDMGDFSREDDEDVFEGVVSAAGDFRINDEDVVVVVVGEDGIVVDGVLWMGDMGGVGRVRWDVDAEMGDFSVVGVFLDAGDGVVGFVFVALVGVVAVFEKDLFDEGEFGATAAVDADVVVVVVTVDASNEALVEGGED